MIHTNLAGKKDYQHIFEDMHRRAIDGMNYGRGWDLGSDGEIAAMRYVRDNCGTSSPVIFDVGANIGNYSIHIAKNFTPDAEIHSFEPGSTAFTKLKQNLTAYTNVSLHNFGFGEKEETLRLYMNEQGSSLGSVYKRELGHFNISMKQSEEIRIRTIDNFCAENSVDKIDFLKLDIEGHELAALHGAEKMLNSVNIRFLQFEFGGCNIDSRTFFRDFWLLLSSRYKIYRIVSDGLHPIPKYEERLEIFTTVNYFAELR